MLIMKNSHRIAISDRNNTCFLPQQRMIILMAILLITATAVNAAARKVIHKNKRAFSHAITKPAISLPTISYAGPKTYLANEAIAALTPTSSGVAAPGYSSSIISIGQGFVAPYDVAVDAQGDIYIVDNANNAIKKIPAGGGAVVTVASGFSSPAGVAVDALGNIYVADQGTKTIKKIPAGSNTPVVYSSGYNDPLSVAVSGAGNVYVVDQGTNLVYKIPAGGGTPILFGSGYNSPRGIAVDAAGNVYVANEGNTSIMEMPAGGGAGNCYWLRTC